MQRCQPLFENRSTARRRWAASTVVVAMTSMISLAQAQTVTPKLLNDDAFTVPTLALLQGCGVPEQAAVAIRVLSEVPGAKDTVVPPAAPWCQRLSGTAPTDTTSPEVVQMDQIDFVSNDGGKTLNAVGADGDMGTLDTRAAQGEASSNGGPKLGFWKRVGHAFKADPASAASSSEAAGDVPDGAPDVPPPSFHYVVTPSLLLLERPGGIFAFDRRAQRFCPIGIAVPGVSSEHAMYQISDGRLLVVSWSLPTRDKAVVQHAQLILPPAMCPSVPDSN